MVAQHHVRRVGAEQRAERAGLDVGRPHDAHGGQRRHYLARRAGLRERVLHAGCSLDRQACQAQGQ